MVDYTVDDLAALALAIYGEARSEPRIGQDAVAHVTIGRARRAGVPVEHVVYGSGEYQNGQYSFANPGIYSHSLGTTPSRDPKGWAKAVAVAEDALEGRTKDPTGGATHYFNPEHNSATSDEWAKTMDNLGMIGNRQFWREKDGAVGITRAAARSRHRREPGQGHLVPGVFGYDVLFALDTPTGPAIPLPTERGVSAQTDLVRRQMLDPHSGNMGLASRQEPAWSDQFAPGGGGLLGADPTTPQAPLEYFGPSASRSDYPTGPTDPAPWVDDFAPAPAYPPRMASRERFEKTFARPDPHAPVLQPGMSDGAKAVAMRDLADRMARAGIAGLDGRPVTAAPVVVEEPGRGSVEAGIPPVPHI